MYGKMLNTIINIMFITYLLLLVSFYFLHEGIKENINNINYETVDSVATQGIFNVETYNNLKERVITYGGTDCNYSLTIKYEEKTSPGVYNTHFVKDTISPINSYYPTNESLRQMVDPDGIITDTQKHVQTGRLNEDGSPYYLEQQIRPMHKGDKITIYLEDQNQTLYGKLITMPFMGLIGDYTDFRIKSLKSSMIGRDANKLYNGYEVIDEINDPTRTYIIQVRTEMSTTISGSDTYKIYNPGTRYEGTGNEEGISPIVLEVTPTVPSEMKVGTYHIFDTLNYYRVWDDYGVGDTPDGVLNSYDTVTFYQTTD